MMLPRVSQVIPRPVMMARVAHESAALAGRSAWIEASLVVGLGVGHLVAVWGMIGLAWGDYGVWLHATERAAAGETPYVDFYWMYPPLALWMLGGVTRVFGPSLVVIWTTTSLIYAAGLVTFWWYVRALLPNVLRLPILAGGILLALAYANHQSAPLPLGMYTPAAPLAGVLMLIGAGLLVRLVQTPSPNAAAALGAVAALAIFTKQDAWLPAVYAVGVSAIVLWRRREWRNLMTLCATGAVVTIGLLGVLAAQSGWARVPWAFWTPNVIEVLGGRGVPTWERLTVQLGAVALALCVVGIVARRWAHSIPGITGTRVLAAAAIASVCLLLHVVMSVRAGMQLRLTTPEHVGPVHDAVGAVAASTPALIMAAVQFTGERLLWFALPPLLPGLVALSLLASWKSPAIASSTRRLLLVLLGYALAARARRQFELVDWYHVLIELPVYAATLAALVRERATHELRAVALTLGLFVPIGAIAYREFGSGPLTKNHPRATFTTPNKGTVRISRNGASDLTWLRAALDSVDPSRTRPLMAHGQTGGFNYFVDRPSATSIMGGFRLTHVPAEHTAREIAERHPRRLMLDLAIIDRLTEVRLGVDLTRWDLNIGPTVMVRDRAHFEQLRSDCPRVAHKGRRERPLYTLYACELQSSSRELEAPGTQSKGRHAPAGSGDGGW